MTGTTCSGSLQSCPAIPAGNICPNGLTCADPSRCATSCSAHADCIESHYCQGGSCVAKRANGVSCLGASDIVCLSNNCGPTSNCLECYLHADCRPGAAYCQNFTCQQCATSGICVQAGLGNSCNAISGRCTCANSSDCTNPRGPRCNTGAAIPECTCGGGNVCAVGQRCTDATANGSCKWETGWPCTANNHCFSGICNTATRTCN